MSSIADQDLIAEFVVESLEHLSDIESQLLAIEAGGEDLDADLVNTVFRAIHSAKGAAGFLGLHKISELAHNMENVLNLFRNKNLVPTTANIDVLLRCADVLRQLLQQTTTSNEADITRYVEALTAIAEGRGDDVSLGAPAAPSADGALGELDHEDDPTDQDDASDELDDFGLSDPGGESVGPAQTARTNSLAECVDTSGSQANAGRPTPAATPPATAPPPSAAAGAPAAAAGKAAGEGSIRVSVGLLDDLMNLAGELVLSRNRLLQVVAAGESSQIEAVATGLDHVTAELQEAIMRTRMQAIGNVFGKFRRVVRDLSVKLGKDCQLHVDGEDVEVDKSIIEAISDPLTHLVRNAVDHGIEPSEQRVALGKPASGTIWLRAFHQAGKVHISITDDGKGIDAVKLREAAVSRGIISAEQAREMGDQEAVRLIFHPGFSLAERVSDVSGRGVGMDVVRSNIEKLSGTVAIETTPGVGTRIDVRLPLTLAIVPSLIVRCGSRKYAIPQASISELVRIRAAEVSRRIERVKKAEMFRLRGVLLPLVRLNDALALKQNQYVNRSGQAVYIIVVESGSLRYGLIVDSVADSEEIVVKPLGRHLQESICLAGATVLGDGTVAPILDVTGIATHMELKVAHQDTSDQSQGENEEEETQISLILRNHPDEQFAIPMQLIARLERIKVQAIQLVGGQEVLNYRGGSLPLLRLEQFIAAQPAMPSDSVSVVVFTVAKREVGLIVPQLVDIRPISTNIDTRTLRQTGVIGSLIVQDTTTRLLNIYELAQMAHPDWFVQSEQQIVQTERGPARLLVVEDSAFFRTQLVAMLEGVGYDVASSEDGEEAWALLKNPVEHFDMVITDIEMPRMDGLALSRNIRGDVALSRMPVIAVTSLGSDEDIRRGEESGIDAYHIKLEREELLATIAAHLKKVGVPAASGSTMCAAY